MQHEEASAKSNDIERKPRVGVVFGMHTLSLISNIFGLVMLPRVTKVKEYAYL